MEIEFTLEARQQLFDLPRTIQARVAKIIERLKAWPNVSGVKPLNGPLAGKYRVRTGDYRVQFYPELEVIVVEKMGHRDGFYDE